MTRRNKVVFEWNFIWLGIIQMIGFFVEGAAGFGSTVISAPFATSILGIKAGVPFGTIMSVILIVPLALISRNNISWKDLGKIFLACLPGLFLGQYLFKVINPDIAKVGIGIAVTIIASFKIYQNIFIPFVLKKVKNEEEKDTVAKKIFRFTCLIVGGAVHGAFNIGGPLITVYTLEAVKDKTKFRNTMMGLWAILDSMNTFNHYRNGTLTPLVWSAVLACLPLAVVGFLLGIKYLNKIDREQFLRFVYVILFAVGLNTLVRSILVFI